MIRENVLGNILVAFQKSADLEIQWKQKRDWEFAGDGGEYLGDCDV